MSHHSKNSSVNISFTAADSKRQLQSILGKNAIKDSQNNPHKSSNSSAMEAVNERKQLLSEKEQLLKEKKKFNEMKRKKLQKSAKKKTSKKHKMHKSSDQRNKNDKIVKEQQKISTEWMKISKEKDALANEKIKLKKEKLKLNKEHYAHNQELQHLIEEKKKVANIRKKWKQESDALLKDIETKYSAFQNMNDKKSFDPQYIGQRKTSLTNHVNNLAQMATAQENEQSKNEEKKEEIPVNLSSDITEEKLKLRRLQKAAKDSQKRAEKTLSELYRKKQELKKERASFEDDRMKFKRMENEYNQFIKEKQRLKKEKRNLLKTQKSMMISAGKKSRMQLTEAAELENEKMRLAKTKNVLEHKKGLLTMHQHRQSANNLQFSLNEQREYRDLKKRVTMYQDQIETLENQNRILQRKIAKRDRFASDYAEDMALGQKNMTNTKYLISTLRSKVIELQSRNKLLTKLIKRHKNVNDAYQSLSDLKQARKVITKLVIENDELNKRVSVLTKSLKRLKSLGEQYQSKLYKMYDDDEGDDEKEEKDFNFESMNAEEMNALYDSMKQKIANLMHANEEIEDTLQDKETELAKFESYANEWDIKHRLGEDRGKALYGKLRIGNEKLQQKLDVIYAELEKEKAAASTWQNTIENRLLNGGDNNDGISVGEDEKLILINQLKEENKKLKTEFEFNNKADVKGHKAIAMDINEQFGTGLFNNLQYILMDADLNNDSILKLKIKDKNDEIYKVVLIKQGTGTEDKDKNDKIVKPIVTQQKNMINTLTDISNIISGYDERISRICEMLPQISKASKPQFDLVVSEPTHMSPIGTSRQSKTMRRFAKTKYRSDSMESLDSVYDLSHEDNITKYGMAVANSRHGDVNSRISQFSDSATPVSLYYPNQSGLNSLKAKENEENASKLTAEDVGNIFDYYDSDTNGTISVKELIRVFQQLGVDISDTVKLESIVQSLDVDSDGIVTRNNFIEWWFSSDAITQQFDGSIRSLLQLQTNNDNFVGHKSDELHAFAQYLNRIFGDHKNDTKTGDKLHRYLPVDSGDGGHDLLSKCVDGVLLAKMINFAVPNTIDERVLHFRDFKTDAIAPKQIVENLNIVLSSCKALGIDLKLEDISVEKFLDPSHYEDTIRQILSGVSRIHLSKTINLKDNPVLIRLSFVYEDDAMIKSLTSEQWLKRWVNYQLKRSGEDKKIRNFGKDFRDGSVLSHVLDSVTKRKKKRVERFDVNKALSQPTYARPGYIIETLQKQFGMTQVFLAANDILSGNSRLICLLCAQIFDKFKGMKKINKQELQQFKDLYAAEETNANNDNSESDKAETNNSNPDKVDKQLHFADNKESKHKYKKGDWDTHKGRKRKASKHGSNSNPNMHLKVEVSEAKDSENKESESVSERQIREERDIANWMNEIFSANKLKQYKIANLTKDIENGLILLHFMHLMSPKSVQMDSNKYVNSGSDLSRQQCLTNCHYVISLIKKEPFASSFFEIESIPNDGGNDIYNGNTEVIFKICHNLINYHYIVTISQLLTFKATEFDIIHWTNAQLSKKLKAPRFCSYDEKKLHSFGDSSLKSCLYYIDLLLMLCDDPRNDIDRDIVIHKNNRTFPNNDYTKAECLSNARYALSIARKFGAIFYISPFDLVNVASSETTMSFVMCIVLLILTSDSKKKNRKMKRKIIKENNLKNTANIDTLTTHLQELKENGSNQGSDSENNSISTPNVYFNNEELSYAQSQAHRHGRKESVLKQYGIITDNTQLQELTDISRQYSTPNIVTPRAQPPTEQ